MYAAIVESLVAWLVLVARASGDRQAATRLGRRNAASGWEITEVVRAQGGEGLRENPDGTYEDADGVWRTRRAHPGWQLYALVRHQMVCRDHLGTAGQGLNLSLPGSGKLMRGTGDIHGGQHGWAGAAGRWLMAAHGFHAGLREPG